MARAHLQPGRVPNPPLLRVAWHHSFISAHNFFVSSPLCCLLYLAGTRSYKYPRGRRRRLAIPDSLDEHVADPVAKRETSLRRGARSRRPCPDQSGQVGAKRRANRPASPARFDLVVALELGGRNRSWGGIIPEDRPISPVREWSQRGTFPCESGISAECSFTSNSITWPRSASVPRHLADVDCIPTRVRASCES